MTREQGLVIAGIIMGLGLGVSLSMLLQITIVNGRPRLLCKEASIWYGGKWLFQSGPGIGKCICEIIALADDILYLDDYGGYTVVRLPTEAFTPLNYSLWKEAAALDDAIRIPPMCVAISIFQSDGKRKFALLPTVCSIGKILI